MQRYRVVIMLVLFGVLPVVAAFFVALQFLEEQDEEAAQEEVAPIVEAPPPVPESPPKQVVLATARALPVGTLLGTDDLTKLSLDSGDVDEEEHFVVVDAVDAVEDEKRKRRGYAVRAPLAEGAPLTHSSVVGPRQRGFLAAVLKPGTRAVTIRVGPATSHAGLIDPGDRVDVVLSAELAIDAGDRSVFARTIVEDVRVVAIDRQPGTDADPDPDPADPPDQRTEIVTATLEARPMQVDRLVLGEAEGRLSLVVRSLLDPPASEVAAGGEAVDMREMLLSSSDFSSSEARLRRAQALNDVTARTQLVESKAQLRTATLRADVEQEVVRIFRGSEPAEEVVFERQREP